MTHEPEALPVRTVVATALGLVAITALLAIVAWWLVVPSAPSRAPAPSPIEHALFVARPAPGPRLPIARAIEAAVADPSLIGGHR